MFPTKRSRRVIGKAGTDALVAGIQIYGPHAIGVVLFAGAIVVVSELAHVVFGMPLQIGVPGAFVLSAVGHFSRRPQHIETGRQR